MTSEVENNIGHDLSSKRKKKSKKDRKKSDDVSKDSFSVFPGISDEVSDVATTVSESPSPRKKQRKQESNVLFEKESEIGLSGVSVQTLGTFVSSNIRSDSDLGETLLNIGPNDKKHKKKKKKSKEVEEHPTVHNIPFDVVKEKKSTAYYSTLDQNNAESQSNIAFSQGIHPYNEVDDLNSGFGSIKCKKKKKKKDRESQLDECTTYNSGAENDTLVSDNKTSKKDRHKRVKLFHGETHSFSDIPLESPAAANSDEALNLFHWEEQSHADLEHDISSTSDNTLTATVLYVPKKKKRKKKNKEIDEDGQDTENIGSYGAYQDADLGHKNIGSALEEHESPTQPKKKRKKSKHAKAEEWDTESVSQAAPENLTDDFVESHLENKTKTHNNVEHESFVNSEDSREKIDSEGSEMIQTCDQISEALLPNDELELFQVDSSVARKKKKHKKHKKEASSETLSKKTEKKKKKDEEICTLEVLADDPNNLGNNNNVIEPENPAELCSKTDEVIHYSDRVCNSEQDELYQKKKKHKKHKKSKKGYEEVPVLLEPTMEINTTDDEHSVEARHEADAKSLEQKSEKKSKRKNGTELDPVEFYNTAEPNDLNVSVIEQGNSIAHQTSETVECDVQAQSDTGQNKKKTKNISFLKKNDAKEKIDHKKEGAAIPDVLVDSVHDPEENPPDAVLETTVEFNIPPLHQCENVRLLSKEQKAEFAQLGVKIRGGRWTKKETDLLIRNWQEFMQQFKFENPAALLGINSQLYTQGYKKEVAEFIKNTHFYVRLAKDLDDRTLNSVYRKARSVLDPQKLNGALSVIEVRHIKEHQARLGNKWTKISGLINLPASKIAVSSRCHKNGQANGRWTKKEEKKLKKAIYKFVTDVKAISCKPQNIPWQKISECVKTRNAFQCYQHWVDVMGWTVDASQRLKWDSLAKAMLIYQLYKNMAEDVTKVDWVAIFPLFKCYVPSYYTLAQKWRKLLGKHVKGYKSMTHRQHVTHLFQNELVSLLVRLGVSMNDLEETIAKHEAEAVD